MRVERGLDPAKQRDVVGAELSFEYNEISPRLVVVIQGVVILFSGALEHMFRPALARLLKPKAPAVAGQRA